MYDLMILGATGKVGRLLRSRWDAPLSVAWQTRDPAADGRWLHWTPDQPLLPTRMLFVLSGVTSGPPEALAQNPAMGLAIAKAALRAGVEQVVLASTMAVYGRAAFGTGQGRFAGAREEDAPQDPNPYGASKWAQERVMADVLGDRLCALRLGNVVGADLLGVMRARGGALSLDRFADGTGPVRSYLGAGLLASALAALAGAGTALPDVLNFAAPAPLAMADLLQASGIPYEWKPAPLTAVPLAAMDCTRLQGLLPFMADPVTARDLAQDWLEPST